MRGEPLDRRGQIVSGELPVERLRDLVRVALELVERACEHAEVSTRKVDDAAVAALDKPNPPAEPLIASAFR